MKRIKPLQILARLRQTRMPKSLVAQVASAYEKAYRNPDLPLSRVAMSRIEDMAYGRPSADPMLVLAIRAKHPERQWPPAAQVIVYHRGRWTTRFSPSKLARKHRTSGGNGKVPLTSMQVYDYEHPERRLMNHGRTTGTRS